MKIKLLFTAFAFALGLLTSCNAKDSIIQEEQPTEIGEGNIKRNASDYGFLPSSTASQNVISLQNALDEAGDILITIPGVYEINNTLKIGSNTRLICSEGVSFKKVDSWFGYVIINKGAYSREIDHNITIEGLHIMVNGYDFKASLFPIVGLIAQVAFYGIQNLTLNNLSCEDLGSSAFFIQVCSFEHLTIQKIRVKGDKDGIHLGTGKHFIIRDVVAQTKDDAIALNAHDYVISNPELGSIENGLIDNVTDLSDGTHIGFTSRILSGAWTNWYMGMKVRNSDTVITRSGKMYRVYESEATGKEFTTTIEPNHTRTDTVVYLNEIPWLFVKSGVSHNLCK